jgi:hypothetical protein
MKPSEEKKRLRNLDAITRYSRAQLSTALDPQYADEIYKLYNECYEAAMAHPDWDSDGEVAFCVDSCSRQKTAEKLLAWYRARRDDAKT